MSLIQKIFLYNLINLIFFKFIKYNFVKFMKLLLINYFRSFNLFSNFFRFTFNFLNFCFFLSSFGIFNNCLASLTNFWICGRFFRFCYFRHYFSVNFKIYLFLIIKKRIIYYICNKYFYFISFYC